LIIIKHIPVDGFGVAMPFCCCVGGRCESEVLWLG